MPLSRELREAVLDLNARDARVYETAGRALDKWIARFGKGFSADLGELRTATRGVRARCFAEEGAAPPASAPAAPCELDGSDDETPPVCETSTWSAWCSVADAAWAGSYN